MHLNIKKGDEVKMLSGKDKGKKGKVLSVSPKTGKIIVEGLNVHVRFSKPRKMGEKGQRMEMPSAINQSKVMVVCPHCGKTTRIAHEVNDKGNFRKCRNCNKLLS